MQMQIVISEKEFQILHWKIAAHIAETLNIIQVDCINRDTKTTVGNVETMLLSIIREVLMEEIK